MLPLALLLTLLPAHAGGPPEAHARVLADPTDVIARAEWADSLVEDGCASVAERVFREHLALDPEDPDRWALLARAEPSEARGLMGEALRLDPEHPLTWSTRAQWHAHRGEHEDARVAAAHALRTDGTLAEAWRVLLASSRALGMDEEARRAAREAVAWVPDEPAVWLTLGEPEDLEEGLEQLPDQPDLLVALARHHLLEGDIAGARGLLDRAGGQGRGYRQVAPLVACALEARLDIAGARLVDSARSGAFSDPRGARTLLDAQAHLWSACPAAWNARAGMGRAMADAEGAHADLERALDLDPDDPWLLEAVALSLLDRGERSRARELLGRARSARPDDLELALAHAALLDDPEASRLALEELAEASPLDADVVLALAGVLASLGRREDALDSLLDAKAGGACQDDLHAASLALAGPLDRVADVEILWESPPPRPRPTGPDPEVDEEVVVQARSEVERLRGLLQARLVEIGYREGRNRGDRLVFRPDKPIMPVVTLHDDGALDVQQAGFVTMPDGETRTISERKMAPRRARVLEAIWPEILALREAIAMAHTAEAVWAGLPDRLDALWHEGVSLDGGPTLVTPAERRAHLLHHWSTRTCSPAGDAVRAGIERYLTLEIQPSGAPATRAELDAANGASACERVLVLQVPD